MVIEVIFRIFSAPCEYDFFSTRETVTRIPVSYPIYLDNSGFADLIPGRQAGMQSALAAFFYDRFLKSASEISSMDYFPALRMEIDKTLANPDNGLMRATA